MKKIFTILFCFIASINIWGEEITVTTGENSSGHSQTPLVHGPYYNFATQQIYTATELGGSSNRGDIKSIFFYYKTGNGTWCSTNRTSVKIFINSTNSSNFSAGKFIAKGTQVYSSSSFNTPSTAGWYELELTTPFSWDGTSNIVVTVIDNSNARVSISANKYHYVYSASSRAIYTTGGTDDQINENITGVNGSAIDVVANAKFTIDLASSGPDAPTNVNASTISYNSAVLSWDAVEGADGYEVRYGTTSGSLGDAIDAGNNTSYTMSNLEPSTRYYYQVRTVVGEDQSAWTTEAYFNTAAHSHNEITFSKWNFSGTLPSSTGNYYLAQNVTLSSNWEPAGTINICLNGKTINFGSNYGDIDDDATIAFFDDNAVGCITSSNAIQTLLVDDATLAIHGATITNTGGGRAIRVINNGSASTDDIIALSDATDNSSTLAEYDGITVNVNLARSWVADGYYSTLCLPFALSSAQVTSIFGTGTELAKLTSSSIEGEEITITFTSANSIEAGKPYIILPKENAVNPSINNITLSSSTTDATTTYVDFIGTLSPTYLAASEDILFLGANNAIGWPAAAGYLKGMRAYFQLHSLPAGAPALRHARLIAPGHSTPTALDEANENKNIQKRLENGQLIIIRDGKKYNVIGGQQ